MNEDGRREIPEWIVWLALALLALLASLPFVNEGNVDRYFRVLAASTGIIMALIMLLGTMFPRGLRLPLGRLVLRIAPPAAYFVSYYSASRWLDDVRSRFLWVADELDELKGEQDATTAEILLLNAKIAVEIGLDSDPAAKLANDMLFRAYTNYDAVLSAAIAAAIDALRETFSQPPRATTVGILDQVAAMGSAADVAIGLIKTRMNANKTFVGDTFTQVLAMTQDSLTRLEQRNQGGAAQLANIAAEVAEVTQPGRGRPPKREWSDDEIRALHAAYLVRDEQTAAQFAKRNHLTESQMFKLFRRVGITKKGPGNYDSEL